MNDGMDMSEACRKCYLFTHFPPWWIHEMGSFVISTRLTGRAKQETAKHLELQRERIG